MAPSTARCLITIVLVRIVSESEAPVVGRTCVLPAAGCRTPHSFALCTRHSHPTQHCYGSTKWMYLKKKTLYLGIKGIGLHSIRTKRGTQFHLTCRSYVHFQELMWLRWFWSHVDLGNAGHMWMWTRLMPRPEYIPSRCLAFPRSTMHPPQPLKVNKWINVTLYSIMHSIWLAHA